MRRGWTGGQESAAAIGDGTVNEHTIPDASSLAGWRKSTYSGNEGGSCVEVMD